MGWAGAVCLGDTRTLLRDVAGPLATVFLPKGSTEGRKAEKVLQTYVSINPRISHQFMDPEKDLLKVRQTGYRRAKKFWWSMRVGGSWLCGPINCRSTW
jgi:hypothetical protein